MVSHNLLLVRVFYLIYHKLHQANTDARSVLLFASLCKYETGNYMTEKQTTFDDIYFLSTYPVNKPIMKIGHHDAKKILNKWNSCSEKQVPTIYLLLM